MKTKIKIVNTFFDSISIFLFLIDRLRYPMLPQPLIHLDVPVKRIKLQIRGQGAIKGWKYRLSGRVKRKDWKCLGEVEKGSNLLAKVFSALFIHQMDNPKNAIQRLGIPDSDKKIFTQNYERIRRLNYQRLFESIFLNQFETSLLLKGNHDPFFLSINASGEFLFITGKHRLAMAKAAGHETIPARISYRHADWLAYRLQFFNRLKKGALLEPDIQQLDHPDLGDMISRARDLGIDVETLVSIRQRKRHDAGSR